MTVYEPPAVRRWPLRLSLALNAALAAALAAALVGAFDADPGLAERHYSGAESARDKVAVVRVSGVLLEGANGFAFAQIEKAARDPAVKAVVLRVDSPGGTVGASEQLHRAVLDLRDNTHRRFAGAGPKPVTASFGAVAASGGYYVAMPAGAVYAEPTTITGSIGVFAALPNVAALADKAGVKLTVVKAGAIKAGGSPFHALTPADRQPWQDVVDSAYDRFLTVVAAGRPKLTREALAAPVLARTVSRYDDRGNPAPGEAVPVSRSRADGGTFTPGQALELGLIDGVADLPDVVAKAAAAANLTSWRAVRYEEPKSWAEWATGVKLAVPADPADLAAHLTAPRVVYLAPGYEASFAAARP